MTADPGGAGGAPDDGHAGDGPFGLASAHSVDDPLTGDPDTGDDTAGRTRPKKAPNAFRTISEVADDLHIPQHVLRVSETKFHQVKPMKRGGGRRYYRPDDIALLRRISNLPRVRAITTDSLLMQVRE